jgi:tetratricopeptide (TPR) repeat protein
MFALMRGELQSVRQLASAFLKEAEAAGRAVEAGVARRGLAYACYQAADFPEARIHCERALEDCDPENEREALERFHDATGPVVLSILAVTMWQLGEVDRARELIEQANLRASELGHAPSMTQPLRSKANLEILRGDAAAALSVAEALDALGADYGMPFWRTSARLSAGWARGRLHDAAAGAEDLRRALADRIDQDVRFDIWFQTGLLAELEAETLGLESALARIDEAMALARQVETGCNLPFLHLLRGKLLLERDPSNSAPGEEAFQTALEIAKQQGARSWGLRAALSLAKLYQSTDRPVDAHAVLAPALEGFSPTPEMPEIAEAQVVLSALVNVEEVKAAATQRERRLRLQTAYGQAVMWSKGFTADETKAAFARAAELAATSDDFSQRFAAAHGQWTLALVGGELKSARELASAFLREAESGACVVEVGVARRGLAIICYLSGDFAGARTHCERALDACDPQHEEAARERFGEYTGTLATAVLAEVTWQLGEVERARELIETVNRRATELGHAPSMAPPLYVKSRLEILRGDAAAALCAAEALEALARERGMTNWRNRAELFAAWARARLFDPVAEVAAFRQALAALADQGHEHGIPFFHALLADVEAETLGADYALLRIDEALALANQIDFRSNLAFLHRLRGEILLKRDPSSRAPAEDAFQTAIAVAREQGARSPRLQAALALAKLYQSTDRPVEACALLAPALEGFSPTPEMPEIAEAQALLERLAHRGDGAVPAKDPATEG